MSILPLNGSLTPFETSLKKFVKKFPYFGTFFVNLLDQMQIHFYLLIRLQKIIIKKKLIIFFSKETILVEGLLNYPKECSTYFQIFLSFLFFLWIFYFIWNISDAKPIKICCILRCAPIVSIHIKSYPMSSYWFVLIKICYVFLSFTLSKLFLESTPLNLGSFW